MPMAEMRVPVDLDTRLWIDEQGHLHPFPPKGESARFTLRQLYRGRVFRVGDVSLHFDEGWFTVMDHADGDLVVRMSSYLEAWFSRFGLIRVY